MEIEELRCLHPNCFAGAVKATGDFASREDGQFPVFEIGSGHKQVRMDAESDWQPRPHAFSATNTLATPNLHIVEFTKAEARSSGSLMELSTVRKQTNWKRQNKIKAASLTALQTKRDVWQEMQMTEESVGNIENHDQRMIKIKVLLGEENPGQRILVSPKPEPFVQPRIIPLVNYTPFLHHNFDYIGNQILPFCHTIATAPTQGTRGSKSWTLVQRHASTKIKNRKLR